MKQKELYLYLGSIFRVWEDGTKTHLAYDDNGLPVLHKEFKLAVSKAQFKALLKRTIADKYGVPYHAIECNEKYIYKRRNI